MCRITYQGSNINLKIKHGYTFSTVLVQFLLSGCTSGRDGGKDLVETSPSIKCFFED